MIKLFRSLVILPIIYVLGGLTVNALSKVGVFLLPIYVYPLLPTKSIYVFLAFSTISLLIKARERRYYKQGGTEEGYEDFLNTKANSWMFASSTAKTLALYGLIDTIAFFAVMFIFNSETLDMLVSAINLGDGFGLLLFAPFVLLYSYNRKHKPSSIDILMPIGAVVLIAVVYMEGIFQILMI